MKVLAIDPSGNFNEGKGVTGMVLRDDKATLTFNIRAEDYETAMEYYDGIIQVVLAFVSSDDKVVIEGYRLYNHAGMKAQTQSNSTLETPQLIGIILYECWKNQIPIHVQYAVEVKNRWADEVLLKTGLLTKKGNRFYLPSGAMITNHERDAYRHLLHFELKEASK